MRLGWKNVPICTDRNDDVLSLAKTQVRYVIHREEEILKFSDIFEVSDTQKVGALTIITPPELGPSSLIFDYQDFAQTWEDKVRSGGVSRALRIKVGPETILDYYLFDRRFFCLILRDVAFPRSRFVADGYFVFRVIFSGNMIEQTEDELRDLSGVDCSVLSPSDASSGWRAQAPIDAHVTSVVLFCVSDRIVDRLDDLSDVPWLSASASPEDQLSLARIRATSDVIRSGKALIDLDPHSTFTTLSAEAHSLAIMTEFLTSLSSNEAAPETTLRISKKDVERLEKAKAIVEVEYADALTIPVLGREVGLNRRKLTEGFREVFGSTVHDYIIEQRMAAAERLMADGEAITEVAFKVGYSSHNSFSRAFKKYFGVPPGAYKARR